MLDSSWSRIRRELLVSQEESIDVSMLSLLLDHWLIGWLIDISINVFCRKFCQTSLLLDSLSSWLPKLTFLSWLLTDGGIKPLLFQPMIPLTDSLLLPCPLLHTHTHSGSSSVQKNNCYSFCSDWNTLASASQEEGVVAEKETATLTFATATATPSLLLSSGEAV